MQDYIQGEITLQVDKINRLYHVLDPEQTGIQVVTTPNSDIVRIQYNMPYTDMSLLEQNLRSAGSFIRFISNIRDTNGNGEHTGQDYQGEEYFTGPHGGAVEYPEEHQFDQGHVEYGNTGYSRVYEENYNQPPVGTNQPPPYYDPMDNQYQPMGPGGRKPQNPPQGGQLRPDFKGANPIQPQGNIKRGPPQYPPQGEMMRGNPNLYDQKTIPQGPGFKPYPNQPQPAQNPQFQQGAKPQPPMRRPIQGGYPDDQYYDDQGYYEEADQPDYYQDQQMKGNRPIKQPPQQPGINPGQPPGGRYPQGVKQPQVNPAPQMMPGNQNPGMYGKGQKPPQTQGRGYPGDPQQRYPAGGDPGYGQDYRQPQGGQFADEGQNFPQQYPPRGQDKWNQPPPPQGTGSGSNQGAGSKNSHSSGAQKSQGKPQVQSAQNTPNIHHGHTGVAGPADKRGSGQQHVRGASANVPRGGHQGTGPNSSAGSQSGRGGLPGPVPTSVAGQLHSSQKIKQQQGPGQAQQWAGKGNKKGMRDDGSVSSQSIGQSAGPESFSGSINPSSQLHPQRRGNPIDSQDFGSPAISPAPAKDANLPRERYIDDTVENINRKPGFNPNKKKLNRRAQLLEEYLKTLGAGGEPAPQQITSIGSISNMRVDMGSNVFVSSVALTESNKVDQSQVQSSPSVPHLDFTEQFDEEEDEERRRRDAEQRAKQVAASGPLRQPLVEVGESDEINNDPEEQLESDGEEEDDFMEEEQFYPDFGEEEQKMSPIEERPIAGGRFVGTQGLQVSEASRPKITNKNKPQQSRQPGGDSRN